MMKFFICILMFVSLCGCTATVELRRNEIYKKYPNGDIRNVPNSSCTFLVQLPDGEVRYVRSLGFRNNSITDDVIFFKPVK